ncbi:MAG TPA: oxygenase MpaB family protein [Solirubrobacteraceae bacterium]|jgi:uncharacterized protein (DUF2236 family)|nr:oxygenase MpaB family protein [Solirubrobacteraceae bacterium]
MTDVGLFGPGTVTWKVNREAVLLAGGGRALLLQVAHPSVAAGVVEHSGYDVDPWGRLFRTLDVVTRITFGGADASARASEGLRRAHAGVRGTRGDGVAYRAWDPDLLLWVWATLVESAVLVYTRYVAPLPARELAAYYEEQQRFAVACGVPEGHWPATWPRFMRWYDEWLRDECTVSDDSRAIARAIVDPRLPGLLKPAARPAVELLNLATVGLTPAVVRERYGLEWGPRRERLLGASTGAVRRLLPLLPSLVRELPPARVAERRARARAAAA